MTRQVSGLIWRFTGAEKSPSPPRPCKANRDERLSRGATLVGPPETKTSAVMADVVSGQPHSAGTGRLPAWQTADTLSPDNGGGSGMAYWTLDTWQVFEDLSGVPLVRPCDSRAHSPPALMPGSHLPTVLCIPLWWVLFPIDVFEVLIVEAV